MATRETWVARVREWKRSGLTAADYAEREGLDAGTLTGWRSQLGPVGAQLEANEYRQVTLGTQLPANEIPKVG